MFFELHDEKKIGYKYLTNADLGRSETSNQTHIGLFGDVFTFLPNSFEVNDCMLIYNNDVNSVSLNFNRIQNPNGSYRSPKIRKGERNEISVVTFIRDKANENPSSYNWFLFWFALKGGQPVFFLFNNNSNTFNDILSLGIDLSINVKGKLDENNPQFTSLLNYLEKLVNNAGVEIVEELEIAVQTNYSTNKKFREYDINKAREIFAKIGKEGEFLVNEYFAKLKREKQIVNYKWVNEEKESGYPYDFYYETNTGDVIYLDVKTTNHKFEQKILFSSQEINFAASSGNKYQVFRVYTNEHDEKCLKICSDIQSCFIAICSQTRIYQENIKFYADIETIKFAILPNNKSISFGKQITLTA